MLRGRAIRATEEFAGPLRAAPGLVEALEDPRAGIRHVLARDPGMAEDPNRIAKRISTASLR